MIALYSLTETLESVIGFSDIVQVNVNVLHLNYTLHVLLLSKQHLPKLQVNYGRNLCQMTWKRICCIISIYQLVLFKGHIMPTFFRDLI